uniref:LPP20 family lipoprotein n=1 Tax=Thaumasiovibrio occultus TaxID=1891184 RepID=UPI0018649BEE|nr:LPP20 family lipoprotein [Thaumasiovibrio occultus]
MLPRICLLVAMIVVAACQPIGEMRNAHLLNAVGYASISSQRGDTVEEKQVRAMRASKLDAYRELSEQVYGLRVSAEATMRDQSLETEYNDTSTDGLIRGAKVLKSYMVGDNYVTEVQLDLDLMERLKDMGEVHQVPQNQVTMF